MTPKYICPECGNFDRTLMDDNGLDEDDFEFSLLCKAPDPQTGGICGTQWDPNFDAWSADQEPDF